MLADQTRKRVPFPFSGLEGGHITFSKISDPVLEHDLYLYYYSSAKIIPGTVDLLPPPVLRGNLERVNCYTVHEEGSGEGHVIPVEHQSHRSVP